MTLKLWMLNVVTSIVWVLLAFTLEPSPLNQMVASVLAAMGWAAAAIAGYKLSKYEENEK